MWLAAEILLEVFSLLSRHELKIIRLVSHAWKNSAQVLLFENVNLKLTRESFKRLQNIAHHEELSKYVRKITYDAKLLISGDLDEFLRTVTFVSWIRVKATAHVGFSHEKQHEYFSQTTQAKLETRYHNYRRYVKSQEYLCRNGNANERTILADVCSKLPRLVNIFYNMNNEIDDGVLDKPLFASGASFWILLQTACLSRHTQPLRTISGRFNSYGMTDNHWFVHCRDWDALKEWNKACGSFSDPSNAISALHNLTLEFEYGRPNSAPEDVSQVAGLISRAKSLRLLHLSFGRTIEGYQSSSIIVHLSRVIDDCMYWEHLEMLSLQAIATSEKSLKSLLKRQSSSLRRLELSWIILEDSADSADDKKCSWISVIEFLHNELSLENIKFDGHLKAGIIDTEFPWSEDWRTQSEAQAINEKSFPGLSTRLYYSEDCLKYRIERFVTHRGPSPFQKNPGPRMEYGRYDIPVVEQGRLRYPTWVAHFIDEDISWSWRGTFLLNSWRKMTPEPGRDSLGEFRGRRNAIIPLLGCRSGFTNAYTQDVLHVLRWAIRSKCPEFVEDLWKDPRILVNRKLDVDGTRPLFWALDEHFDEETFQCLLDWPKVDVNLQDAERNTPLSLASQEGNARAVELLLKNGALTELEGQYGKGPLMQAVVHNKQDVARRLLQAGASIDRDTCEGHDGAIHVAIKTDQNLVKLLLEYKLNIECKGDSGNTPLIVATKEDDLQTVELLLTRGVSTEVSNDACETPFQVAVQNGNVKIALVLLKHNASTDKWSDSRDTPLRYALRCGHETLAKVLLLQINADSKLQNRLWTENDLHLAVTSGLEDVVKLLLQPPLRDKLDLELKNVNGETALMLAMHSLNEPIIYSLIAAGADTHVCDRSGKTAIELAILHERHELAKSLQLFGNQNKQVDQLGDPHLIIALKLHRDKKMPTSKWLKLVEDVLKAGTDVNRLGGRDISALHVAVQRRDIALIQLLLSRGAEVDTIDANECTPLLDAVQNGSGGKELEEVLLKKDAKVNVEGGKYGYPLQAAAAAWSGEEVVEMLLSAGANVNAYGGLHETAVHAAVICGRIKVLRLLLEDRSSTADLELKDDHNRTVLQSAIASGDKAVIDMVLKHGANIEALDMEGRTPLLAAVNNEDEELVELLLRYEASTRAKDTKGRTPFLIAIEKDLESIAELLMSTSDVNVQGGVYGSALRAVMYKGNRRVVRKLMDAGAKVDAAVEEID
ncbi:Ankyrin repeat-containing protein [Glarea lozoyensis ATCC 20868]|uniref:Ankyrin repeat-containing protein n=1 Tax=Glarea lozoyensis (strain ATCC 20868 / MF5171) TaxID=1116229 RepID=S3DIH4_GLAL2|nr:Ankyrin repeat-containing protein [Glarea lozoyensis ATCC 20868]EPE31806.1 Ankyrin repeat-containing protein [Glarea lozoyensis ATCC 20868]